MVTRKVRKTDSPTTNGWKQRVMVDAKTITLIISFLLGGGIGNIGIQKFTETDTSSQIEGIDSRLQAVEINFNNYKASQASEQILRDTYFQTKLEYISKSVDELKKLLEEHDKEK